MLSRPLPSVENKYDGGDFEEGYASLQDMDIYEMSIEENISADAGNESSRSDSLDVFAREASVAHETVQFSAPSSPQASETSTLRHHSAELGVDSLAPSINNARSSPISEMDDPQRRPASQPASPEELDRPSQAEAPNPRLYMLGVARILREANRRMNRR